MTETPLGGGPLPLPTELPEEGILVGYSLEQERRMAPIGFLYGWERSAARSGTRGETGTGRASGQAAVAAAGELSSDAGEPPTTLQPILHTGGGHLLTVAPTGAGKGVGCIIPALLRHRGPVIVIDPKGENYAVTAARRRQLGQEIVVLDPIGITRERHPGALNPLDLVDPAEEQSIDDSAMLASMLSGGVEREDPRNLFWYQRGDQLLTGIIQHVATSRDPEDRHLSEVRRILNLPAETFVGEIAAEMKRSSDPDVRQVAGTLVNPAVEMIGSILGMAQNSLGFLRGDLLHRSTAGSTFNLDAVTAGDALSIYIVIPPDKLDSHRNLLRLWIGVLMAALMRRRAPVAHRTLFVLDEAAQLGPLDQFRQAITLMRGYGLQTWSFWQDVSQLRNLYPQDWETMYNNCRVHQAFGFTTLHASTAASVLTGFHDPIEALKLDADEMILSVSGDEPVIAQKPSYLTDPAFRGTFSHNPFYRRSPDEPPTPRRPQRRYVRPSREEEQRQEEGREEERREEARREEERREEERREEERGRSERREAEGAMVEARPAEGRAGDAPNDAANDARKDAPNDAAAGAGAAVRSAGRTGGGPASADPTRAAGAPDADPGAPPLPTSDFYSLPGVRPVAPAEVAPFIELVNDALHSSWDPHTTIVRALSLPFSAGSWICEMTDPDRDPPREFVLKNGTIVFRLSTPATDVFEWLTSESTVHLDPETIGSYIRVRMHFAPPEEPGPHVVESLDEVAIVTDRDRGDFEAYGPHIHPVRFLGDPGDPAAPPPSRPVEAAAILNSALVRIRLTLDPGGGIVDYAVSPVTLGDASDARGAGA